jgi:hypothetical protein
MPVQRLNVMKRRPLASAGRSLAEPYHVSRTYLGADEVVCKALVRKIGCCRGRSVVMLLETSMLWPWAHTSCSSMTLHTIAPSLSATQIFRYNIRLEVHMHSTFSFSTASTVVLDYFFTPETALPAVGLFEAHRTHSICPARWSIRAANS